MKFSKTLIAALLLSSALTYGAGFTILEQSAAGLGRALAGMTVETNDPAAIYFNPATATGPTRPELSIGNHILKVRGHIKDMGSDHDNLGWDESNDLGGWVMVPNMYYVHPINSTVSLGMGVSATSGTKTSYNNYWLGRYGSTLTELSVLDFSAVLAWKVREDLSLGIGLVVEKADLIMEQMVFNGARDLKLSVEGDSIGAGFTLGAMYEPIEGTRIGLGYRSRVKHDMDFDARFKHTSTKGDGSIKMDLPQIVNFGISQNINEKWDVMMDISWSEWSVMDKMTLDFDKQIGLGSKFTKVMGWRDNWRVALGSSYAVTEKLTWRCGLAYDQTPTQNKYRNLKLPDASRYWVSTGIGYKFNDNVRVDVAFTHLFMESKSFKEATQMGTVRAKERCRTEIVSFSLTYSF